MTDLPHKTISAGNSKLARAATSFEQYLDPLCQVKEGKRPEFTFTKESAEKLLKAWDEVDQQIFEQNTAHAAFVMSIKSCAELIEENGIDFIEMPFPEQDDVIKKIVKYITILNNYHNPKTENNGTANQQSKV
jgi:hypothetical protein